MSRINSTAPITKVGAIAVNTSLLSAHNCNAKSSRDVTYVVLHYTGNKGPDTAKANANYFKTTDRRASAHYTVDDSNIYQCIALKDVAWHCGGSKYYSACRNATSIGIEMCCTAGNFKVGSKTIENAAQLTATLCELLGITADKVSTYVIRHYDVTHKSCPDQMAGAGNAEWAAFISRVKDILGNTTVGPTALKATDLKGLTEEQIIAKVGPLFTADQKKSGILASVSLAQFILESGYGKSELAQNANNCFGMKKSLSGNTWPGSSWDGKSVYTKKTSEYTNGKYVTITAKFRKYPSVEASIADHSAYLIGALNGSKKRYAGLAGEKDYTKAITIIKNGGYATSPKYVENVCNVIKKWDLTRFDVAPNPGATNNLYRVRKTWADAKSQKGAYSILANAKACADKNDGYHVYDASGIPLYPVPFCVKLTKAFSYYEASDGKTKAGSSKAGIFTITAVENGYGKLKSGAGWVDLSGCDVYTLVP